MSEHYIGIYRMAERGHIMLEVHIGKERLSVDVRYPNLTYSEKKGVDKGDN